ncbi:MAG: ribose 5-phosphate isomerase B [Rhodospirillales bacterium]|nr:ribose 5-phosphate isomerase B [Rhodospirillales bacterium]
MEPVPDFKTIALGCDHGGFSLKETIKDTLTGRYEIVDLGTHSEESVNYVDYGSAVAESIRDGKADAGIVICGTGIGISIAANRYAAVRAALCTNATMARLTREHNNANVLALGARITGVAVALDCVEAFLSTDYEGGRHEARVEKLCKGI